jgi:hypothetical protein
MVLSQFPITSFFRDLAQWPQAGTLAATSKLHLKGIADVPPGAHTVENAGRE